MNEARPSKGALMAMGGFLNQAPTQHVQFENIAQLQGVVAALIDNLEHYAITSPAYYASYFTEAQRLFELGNMMAVKGLYLSQSKGAQDVSES